MIGIATGQGHHRLHHVEPVHAVIGGFPPEGETADVAMSVLLRTDEIAIERQNSASFFEVDQCMDRCAAGLRIRRVSRSEIDRLVGVPRRFRILLGNEFLKTRTGRGGRTLDQERQTFTVLSQRRLGHFGQGVTHRLDLAIIAAPGVPVGAIGIVQVQDRSLSKSIGASISPRKQRIALDLSGATVAGLDRQRDRAAPQGHGCGEMLSLSVNETLGLLGKRRQLLLRATASGAHATQTRQKEARRHELHPVATAFTIWGDARAGRKLALHPLTEIGLVSQLLQGTPVLRTGLRFVANRGNRLHQRWQVEQLWPG